MDDVNDILTTTSPSNIPQCFALSAIYFTNMSDQADGIQRSPATTWFPPKKNQNGCHFILYFMYLYAIKSNKTDGHKCVTLVIYMGV